MDELAAVRFLTAWTGTGAAGAAYARRLYRRCGHRRPTRIDLLRLHAASARDLLPVGLAAYWNLDEVSGTRADQVGSSTLADNNTVGSTAGIRGNAASFVATSSEYLSIAANAALAVGDVDFTVAAWVKLTTKADRSIAGRWHQTGNQRGWWLRFSNTSDRFQFSVSPNGAVPIFSAVANNLGSPSTATWYHLVGWHDSARDRLGIRVNGGEPNYDVNYVGGVFEGTADFRIGAMFTTLLAQFWNGEIDEVGFWRRLLSPEEQAALYNGGLGTTYSGGAFAA